MHPAARHKPTHPGLTPTMGIDPLSRSPPANEAVGEKKAPNRRQTQANNPRSRIGKPPVSAPPPPASPAAPRGASPFREESAASSSLRRRGKGRAPGRSLGSRMRGGRPGPKHNSPRRPPARPRPAQAPPRPSRHSQFRISEMKTARPRIPSPFDTAGIVARDQGRPATRRTTATTTAAAARSPRGAPQAAAAAASAARMRRDGSRAPAGGGRRGCGAPCRAEAAPQRPCPLPQPLGCPRRGAGHPPARRPVAVLLGRNAPSRTSGQIGPGRRPFRVRYGLILVSPCHPD